MSTPSTQVRYPWRATLRTIFQFLTALAAAWALIVEALNLNPGIPWVAGSLALAAAITRVMALPVVEDLLQRFLPWLAASPREGKDSDFPGYETSGISDAKTLVSDILGMDHGGYDEPPSIDGLAAAEQVVETLRRDGWVPPSNSKE